MSRTKIEGDSRTRNLACEISEECYSETNDPFQLIGNGYCNDWSPYNTEACCWDGGDCIKVVDDCVVTPETCTVINSLLLGNGHCYDWSPYNTEGCCWDAGDCAKEFGGCEANLETCPGINNIGNGICDNDNNNEGCCWDGGECVKIFGGCEANLETCPGIDFIGKGDGCNDTYDTEGCCWDGGDCSLDEVKATLDTGAIVVISATVFSLLIFFSCAGLGLRKRKNDKSVPQPTAAINAGPPGRRPPPGKALVITAEERRSQRRELVLMDIIHKKLNSKSKEPAEQDIVVDLGAAQIEEDMDLPHEEILSLRSLNINHAVQIGTTAEQLNGEGGVVIDRYNDGGGIIVASTDLNRTTGANSITSGVFGNTDDILIETLRSIRSSLNITIADNSFLYSSKACPICCHDYAKGDDVTWSKNEQCCHAFHTDCIMEWLMNHDDCPLCRNNYLGETDAA